MATAMAGLIQAQSDMLITLAEEVDRNEATIADREAHLLDAGQALNALKQERDFYRTAAENAQASAQAGWMRAHALSAELRTAEQHIQTITRNETRYRGQAYDYHVEKTRLAEELRVRDAALAEATAECERLRARAGGAPVEALARALRAETILREVCALDSPWERADERVREDYRALAHAALTGPTPAMLAGRRHEVIGTDPREMTRGWQA